jgi:hypothetical protein
MKDVGKLYGHPVYFAVIWYIYDHFVVILVYISPSWFVE